MTEFETYKDPSDFIYRYVKKDEPHCFNGVVGVRRYKVAIELIDEPVDVIQKRIKKLLNECENYHHREPLIAEAKKYGLDL